MTAHTGKALKLRGLPKDASLSVRPAFTGSLERRLSFKVTVPVAGTYYVIVDNRKNAESRKVRLLIEALRPPPSKSPPKRPDERRLQAT